MFETIQQIIVDVNRNDPYRVSVNKGDNNSRFIQILVRKNGGTYDLTGLQVFFYSKLKTGEEVFAELKNITNPIKGEIKTSIASSIMSKIGEHECMLMLRDGMKSIGTYPFYILVNDSAYNEESIQASNEYSALISALKNAKDYGDELLRASRGLELKYTDTLNEAYNYVKFPQDSLPTKQGFNTCTPKIVWKRNANEILIIQATNKGYLRHQFNNTNGANTDPQNWGKDNGSELIRLVDSRPLESCIVYKDLGTPKTGSLSVYSAPHINANVIEQSLEDIAGRRNDRNLSNKTGNVGYGIYSMLYNTEVVYDINYTLNQNANLTYLITNTGVDVVKIFVNNILVKQFNPKVVLKTGETIGYGMVEFEVPTSSTTKTYELKIRAEGSSGYFYIGCLNFLELKDYNGQDIDNWKAYGSEKGGFVTTGANDYALADGGGRWFGSYHGGERLENCQVSWNTSIYPKLKSNLYFENFGTIVTGEWRVLNQVSIWEKTNLINKANMISLFDLSTDGTIDMKFSFINNSDLLLNAFCTALTCTATTFDTVMLPTFTTFPSTPSGRDISVNLSEGFIRQVDPVSKLQLDIRFTKFNEKNNRAGAYILDHSYYRKFYYNVIFNVRNVVMPTLQFSKALDFSIR